MASAFNWSPGGCCCDESPPYWAMGVDDIGAPTKTRIPKKATITFEGAKFPPIFGFACGNPEWLNTQTHELTAYSPTYPRKYDPEEEGEGKVIQMHWTSANPENVRDHLWPGTAGKPPAPIGTGRIPSRIFASQFIHPVDGPTEFLDAVGPGWMNMLDHFYWYSPTNPIDGYPDGYPENDPMFSRYNSSVFGCQAWQGDLPRLQMEMSIVCGGETGDRLDGLCRAYFSANLISYGAAAPSRPGTTKASKILTDVPFVGHSFPDRTQRICVIPDSIDFDYANLSTPLLDDATVAYDGADNNTLTPVPGQWNFRDLKIHVAFTEWYEGPTA